MSLNVCHTQVANEVKVESEDLATKTHIESVLQKVVGSINPLAAAAAPHQEPPTKSTTTAVAQDNTPLATTAS